MTTSTIERTTQSTCANCPYFQDFGEPNGRGWCATFDQMARLDHERTGACDTEIEALDKEAQQEVTHAPEHEPVSFRRDSVVGLQPTIEATTEFEQGRLHGQNDALAKWHPIYKEPATEYATGYLSGYNAVLHPTTQQPQVSKAIVWSVTRNPQWHWYDVWVGSNWVGRAETNDLAESLAQKYVAMDELIRRQNATVLAAYQYSNPK